MSGTSPSHRDYTAALYAPRAENYLTSVVHAESADLDALELFVRRHAPARLLDLGCGGGHVSYRAAPHAGTVVACDIAAAMLTLVARVAGERGLANIETRQAPAEALPFPDASFDMVVSRFSAHHWTDLAAGLREAARVVVAGGRPLFIDTIAPAAALLDTYLQAIELLRDPSHGRDYRTDEWVAALGAAGFAATALTVRRLRLDFSQWTARTATPAVFVAALRALLTAAPAEVRRYFAIEADGSWTLEVLALEAVRL